jgi:hypothetical protein
MPVHIFLGHLGLGDQILLLPAIFHYAAEAAPNNLYVVCKNIYKASMEAFCKACKNIYLLPIKASPNLNEESASIQQAIQELLATKPRELPKFHLSGFFNSNFAGIYDFPICFYKQLGLDWASAKRTIQIPQTTASAYLGSLVRYIPYIFIHDIASNKRADILASLHNRPYFIINPEYNIYKKGDVFYELAEQFLRGQRYSLIDYKDIIENATELHLITSCYFCFAAGLLDTGKVQRCIAYSRDGHRFPTIGADWEYVDI